MKVIKILALITFLLPLCLNNAFSQVNKSAQKPKDDGLKYPPPPVVQPQPSQSSSQQSSKGAKEIPVKQPKKENQNPAQSTSGTKAPPSKRTKKEDQSTSGAKTAPTKQTEKENQSTSEAKATPVKQSKKENQDSNESKTNYAEKEEKTEEKPSKIPVATYKTKTRVAKVKPSSTESTEIKKAPKTVNEASRKSTIVDKKVGVDNQGRTIYEGPRGGRYYINSNGNKTYVKQDNN